MNKFLVLIALCLSLSANAGVVSFGAGYLVGSSGSSSNEAPATLITSDKHDVIICKKSQQNPLRCQSIPIYFKNEWRETEYTPAQFTTYNGYKYLHKTSMMLYGRDEYFVMEVSK